MRRWDGLVDRYLDEYEARGRAAGTIEGLRWELDRCGTWLKNRRPRLDEVDSDLLIGYLQSRTAFRAKVTLSSVMSKLRGLGEFLTREGLWTSNKASVICAAFSARSRPQHPPSGDSPIRPLSEIEEKGTSKRSDAESCAAISDSVVQTLKAFHGSAKNARWAFVSGSKANIAGLSRFDTSSVVDCSRRNAECDINACRDPAFAMLKKRHFRVTLPVRGVLPFWTALMALPRVVS
jgi:hypothetical protein